jgi:hypothetical protein
MFAYNFLQMTDSERWVKEEEVLFTALLILHPANDYIPFIWTAVVRCFATICPQKCIN